MHTHPGRPPAGLSGRGSRCEATARAARPAAQTKQSALAVSAAQFQMPRPSRRALIGPRARGSVSTGSARPGAALALRPAAALPRAGETGGREGEPGGGRRGSLAERQGDTWRGTEVSQRDGAWETKGRADTLSCTQPGGGRDRSDGAPRGDRE